MKYTVNVVEWLTAFIYRGEGGAMQKKIKLIQINGHRRTKQDKRKPRLSSPFRAWLKGLNDDMANAKKGQLHIFRCHHHHHHCCCSLGRSHGNNTGHQLTMPRSYKKAGCEVRGDMTFLTKRYYLNKSCSIESGLKTGPTQSTRRTRLATRMPFL